MTLPPATWTPGPATAPGHCPACGEPVGATARFCEACGTALQPGSVAAPEAGPALDDAAPITTPTVVDGVEPTVTMRPPCSECDGPVGPDLYCEVCGTKAASARDHYEEHPSPEVAGVCDRGIAHDRNEDAVAVFADPRLGRVALVVCDGVSSSMDSDIASLNAARSALGILRSPTPQGVGTPQSRAAAVQRTFTLATQAANDAVLAATRPGSPMPASCTIACAVVEEGVIRYAGLGDSRVYHFPDDGEPVLLTTDDSMAQQLIEAGVPRAEAETMPQAHTITRWLGQDAADVVPDVGEIPLTGPGWLIVCSDGLWNYASEPARLREVVHEVPEPTAREVAAYLLRFALDRGGRDNISVALARVGDNEGPNDRESRGHDG